MACKYEIVTGFFEKDGNYGKYMSTKVRDEIVIPAGSQLVIDAVRNPQEGKPTHYLKMSVDNSQENGAAW